MTTLLHEARLAAWLSANGASANEVRYARATGGTVRGVRLLPRGGGAGRILFVHATGSDALFPQVALFKSFVGAGHEVFAFDLDGHGRMSTTTLVPEELGSAIPDALAAAGWGEDARATPPSATADGVHVVGHSLGGAVALAFAASPGARLASLTLLATPIRVSITAAAALAEARSLFSRAFLAHWADYGAGLVPPLGPYRRRTFPVRLPAGERRHYIQVVRAAIETLRLEGRAAAVRARTLLVYGARDLVAPAAQGRELAARIPGAAWREEPDCTHLTLPYAAGVARAVLDFLRA